MLQKLGVSHFDYLPQLNIVETAFPCLGDIVLAAEQFICSYRRLGHTLPFQTRFEEPYILAVHCWRLRPTNDDRVRCNRNYKVCALTTVKDLSTQLWTLLQSTEVSSCLGRCARPSLVQYRCTLVHHSQCSTLNLCNIVCTATTLFVALKDHARLLHEHMNPFHFPPDFISRIEYLPSNEMPLRTAAIRRCGFKLPTNDKYQCQKAGDKFQPMVKLWYCRFHDHHAQDRCQVLVEWAGKDAQCEQLGSFDESNGKKLCEWHTVQSKRDNWLERWHGLSTKRKDSTQTSIDHEVELERQDAAIPDDSTPDDVAPPPLSPSDGTEDAIKQAPLIDTEPHSLLTQSRIPEQEPPAGEQFSDAKEFLDDSDSKPAGSNEEDPTITAIERTSASHLTPTFEDDTIGESKALVAASPLVTDNAFREVKTPTNDRGAGLDTTDQSESTTTAVVRNSTLLPLPTSNKITAAAKDPEVRGPPDESRNQGGAPHIRIDSLSPFFSSRLRVWDTEVSTPTSTTHEAHEGLERSPQSTKEAYGTTPPRQLVHARISFLNALRDQQASNSNRIAAVYAQCCVCLEKHGELNMRQVESCKHRYRDLCLRKATRIGSLRRFNCSSCRMWMAEQQEDMINNGRL